MALDWEVTAPSAPGMYVGMRLTLGGNFLEGLLRGLGGEACGRKWYKTGREGGRGEGSRSGRDNGKVMHYFQVRFPNPPLLAKDTFPFGWVGAAD